jgi:hypothetical protein
MWIHKKGIIMLCIIMAPDRGPSKDGNCDCDSSIESLKK